MTDDADKVAAARALARKALAELKKPMTKAEQVKAWLGTLDADVRAAKAGGALLKDIAHAVSTADLKVTVAELRTYLAPSQGERELAAAKQAAEASAAVAPVPKPLGGPTGRLGRSATT